MRPFFEVGSPKTKFEARSSHYEIQSKITPLRSTDGIWKISKQKRAKKPLTTEFARAGFSWQTFGESDDWHSSHPERTKHTLSVILMCGGHWYIALAVKTCPSIPGSRVSMYNAIRVSSDRYSGHTTLRRETFDCQKFGHPWPNGINLGATATCLDVLRRNWGPNNCTFYRGSTYDSSPPPPLSVGISAEKLVVLEEVHRHSTRAS